MEILQDGLIAAMKSKSADELSYYRRVLLSMQPGDTFEFGRYYLPTMGNTHQIRILYPLKWVVMKNESANGRILLITKYCVDCCGYSTMLHFLKKDYISWNNSLARVFLDRMVHHWFGEVQIQLIEETKIVSENQTFNNRLFLLSPDEIPTSYNTRASILYAENDDDNNLIELIEEWWPWWLREKNDNAVTVPYVQDNGTICREGTEPGLMEIGYRPAMWLNVYGLDL